MEDVSEQGVSPSGFYSQPSVENVCLERFDSPREEYTLEGGDSGAFSKWSYVWYDPTIRGQSWMEVLCELPSLRHAVHQVEDTSSGTK